MRRLVVLTVLSVGLTLVALSATADALPGLGAVSVNRGPVGQAAQTVDRSPVGSVRPALPGADRRDPAADRRQATRRHRAQLVARWQGVADCESGGDWSINTGNGYYGGLQFSMDTWRAYGGKAMPHEQPAWYQSKIAERVRTQSGLHHWPHCGQYYGS